MREMEAVAEGLRHGIVLREPPSAKGSIVGIHWRPSGIGRARVHSVEWHWRRGGVLAVIEHHAVLQVLMMKDPVRWRRGRQRVTHTEHRRIDTVVFEVDCIAVHHCIPSIGTIAVHHVVDRSHIVGPIEKPERMHLHRELHFIQKRHTHGPTARKLNGGRDLADLGIGKVLRTNVSIGDLDRIRQDRNGPIRSIRI